MGRKRIVFGLNKGLAQGTRSRQLNQPHTVGGGTANRKTAGVDGRKDKSKKRLPRSRRIHGSATLRMKLTLPDGPRHLPKTVRGDFAQVCTGARRQKQHIPICRP
jgi:hypothetical protein